MTTKKLNSIHEKLAHVQQHLNAPKNQYNKFGNYKYRSCEDILQALKKLQDDVGFIIKIDDEIQHIEGRFYVKAIARFIDTTTGNEINSTAFARESENKKGMDEAQITGATSSYARKYALNALFAIDDTRDSDATNDHFKNKKTENHETHLNIQEQKTKKETETKTTKDRCLNGLKIFGFKKEEQEIVIKAFVVKDDWKNLFEKMTLLSRKQIKKEHIMSEANEIISFGIKDGDNNEPPMWED